MRYQQLQIGIVLLNFQQLDIVDGIRQTLGTGNVQLNDPTMLITNRQMLLRQEVIDSDLISRDVVIVTNELFSDGVTYPPETEQYLDILARLNREIAAEADQVWEVCCGIPVCWKGAAV